MSFKDPVLSSTDAFEIQKVKINLLNFFQKVMLNDLLDFSSVTGT